MALEKRCFSCVIISINHYFQISLVVSELVKKNHTLKNVPLTVIPYYDDFEELEEKKTKTFDYSGEYSLDPLIMDYIRNTQKIEIKFEFKSIKFESIKFDGETSRVHFTKELGDSKDATDFENKLKDFLQSFAKEEIRIPKAIFQKVKEEIENQREEFEACKVHFNFDRSRIVLVGEKNDAKHLVETMIGNMIDRLTEEVQKVSTDFPIEDKNKLKFLNFIGYFEKLMTEIPEVRIHGSDGISEKLTLVGTAKKTYDVQLRIYQDMLKISEIFVRTSYRQIDFLQRTQCKIVNNELKKDAAMLLLMNVEGAVYAKFLQAKIMTLKKCDDNEVILKSNNMEMKLI